MTLCFKEILFLCKLIKVNIRPKLSVFSSFFCRFSFEKVFEKFFFTHQIFLMKIQIRLAAGWKQSWILERLVPQLFLRKQREDAQLIH